MVPEMVSGLWFHFTGGNVDVAVSFVLKVIIGWFMLSDRVMYRCVVTVRLTLSTQTASSSWQIQQIVCNSRQLRLYLNAVTSDLCTR